MGKGGTTEECRVAIMDEEDWTESLISMTEMNYYDFSV